MLLAIDTATRYISLALYDGQTVLAEQTWQTHNNHTTQLAPAIFALLDNSELDIEVLTALAVSTGPGSYTGLRIGVSLAKGIASARHLPLIGVTTLDTLAAGQPYYQSGGGLVVVVQAGRGRLIVQTYRWRKGQWSSRTAPTLMDWDGLLAQIDGPAFITGEIDQDGVDILTAAQAKDTPVTLVPGGHRLRRAGFMAQVAWELLTAAGTKAASIYHPAKLVPIYIKSDTPATPAGETPVESSDQPQATAAADDPAASPPEDATAGVDDPAS